MAAKSSKGDKEHQQKQRKFRPRYRRTLDPRIGRRTGVDVTAGKTIRKYADGKEIFEDYWTDSDPDETVYSSENILGRKSAEETEQRRLDKRNIAFPITLEGAATYRTEVKRLRSPVKSPSDANKSRSSATGNVRTRLFTDAELMSTVRSPVVHVNQRTPPVSNSYINAAQMKRKSAILEALDEIRAAGETSPERDDAEFSNDHLSRFGRFVHLTESSKRKEERNSILVNASSRRSPHNSNSKSNSPRKPFSEVLPSSEKTLLSHEKQLHHKTTTQNGIIEEEDGYLSSDSSELSEFDGYIQLTSKKEGMANSTPQKTSLRKRSQEDPALPASKRMSPRKSDNENRSPAKTNLSHKEVPENAKSKETVPTKSPGRTTEENGDEEVVISNSSPRKISTRSVGSPHTSRTNNSRILTNSPKRVPVVSPSPPQNNQISNGTLPENQAAAVTSVKRGRPRKRSTINAINDGKKTSVAGSQETKTGKRPPKVKKNRQTSQQKKPAASTVQEKSPNSLQDAGPRRSSRTRVPRVFPKLIYQRTSSGNVRTLALEIDKTVMQFHKLNKVKKKEPNKRKAFTVENVASTTVLSPGGSHEIHEDVVHVWDCLNWVGPSGSPSKKNDPYLMTKVFEDSDFSYGFVKLKPQQEKPLQRNGTHQMVFCVYEGTLKVQVNQTSWILQKGDSFKVPQGNVYGIANQGKKDAVIVFSAALGRAVEEENSD